MQPKVIFVHGWGYDTSVWDPIIQNLNNVDVRCIELGFLGDEPQTDFDAKDALIIGHSLGVMWALKHIKQTPKAFISINGFDCFYKFTPAEIFKDIAECLDKDPVNYMKEFWAGNGVKPSKVQNLNVVRIKEGLSWLMYCDENKALKELSCPVSALASMGDKIVPARASKKIWGTHKLLWSKEGDHMLPISNPEFCVIHIQEVIENAYI